MEYSPKMERNSTKSHKDPVKKRRTKRFAKTAAVGTSGNLFFILDLIPCLYWTWRNYGNYCISKEFTFYHQCGLFSLIGEALILHCSNIPGVRKYRRLEAKRKWFIPIISLVLIGIIGLVMTLVQGLVIIDKNFYNILIVVTEILDYLCLHFEDNFSTSYSEERRFSRISCEEKDPTPIHINECMSMSSLRRLLQ